MGKTENKILRGLVFDDEVSLAVLDTTELVNEAIRIHNLSPLGGGGAGAHAYRGGIYVFFP